MSRHSIFLCILCGTVLFSGWWAWRHRSPKQALIEERSTYDYVFHKVVVIKTNALTGAKAFTLLTPELTRTRVDGTGNLVTPIILIPQLHAADASMRAQQGWISADGKLLKLQGNVIGTTPDAADQFATTFRTEHLTVDPQKEVAFTQDPVTILRPGIKQTGTGFEAHLKSWQVTLFSKVESRYDPTLAHPQNRNSTSGRPSSYGPSTNQRPQPSPTD